MQLVNNITSQHSSSNSKETRQEVLFGFSQSSTGSRNRCFWARLPSRIDIGHGTKHPQGAIPLHKVYESHWTRVGSFGTGLTACATPAFWFLQGIRPGLAENGTREVWCISLKLKREIKHNEWSMRSAKLPHIYDASFSAVSRRVLNNFMAIWLV